MARVPDVVRALRTVVDPELGINLVDLGLVYHVDVSDDVATVELTMTSPACPLSEYIRQLVDEAVRAALPDINAVEISFALDPSWSPEMMSDSARRELGR
jgi:metal-sulfur cluster biosynthetic enzyme